MNELHDTLMRLAETLRQAADQAEIAAGLSLRDGEPMNLYPQVSAIERGILLHGMTPPREIPVRMGRHDGHG